MDKEDREEDNILRVIGIPFLVLIAILGLVECGILLYAFINADRVECNLLWCTFISEKESYSIKSTSECFVNGEKINCSEFPGDEHFCFNNTCSMNGVCGGDYDSNLECIEDIKINTLGVKKINECKRMV
jgi:hypothetical protein